MASSIQWLLKSRRLFWSIAIIVMVAGVAVFSVPAILTFLLLTGNVETTPGASPLHTEVFVVAASAHDDFVNALRNAASERGFEVSVHWIPAAEKSTLTEMWRSDIKAIAIKVPGEFHLPTYAVGPDTAEVREASRQFIADVKPLLLRVKGVSQ
jgi:hypothetical protein